MKYVKSFLQTYSWYRKFTINFSEVSRPLCELTRKKSLWKWNEIQEVAFKQLKQALVTAPVLIQAYKQIPFTIRTDAIGYALGAVLTQCEIDEERSIA